MKYISLAFLIIATSIALQAKPKKKKNKNKKTADNIENVRIDSITKANQDIINSLNIKIETAESVTNETNELLNIERVEPSAQWLQEQVYTEEYDNKGNITYHNEHHWRVYHNANKYLDFKCYKNEYDNKNRLISETRYREDILDYAGYETTIVPNHKKEYVYDDSDNIISEKEYYYDDELQALKMNLRKEYAYDSHNKMIEEKNSIPQENNNWEYTTAYEYKYNDAGNKTSKIYCNYFSNNKVFSSKDDFEYDEKGFPISDKCYKWKGDKKGWEIYRKYNYKHFDKNQKLLDSWYDWNEKTEQWVMYKKTEKEFNVNGDETLEVDYFKDNPKRKVVYEYDNNGNKTLYLHYIYNVDTKTWKLETKCTFKYDSRNNRIFKQTLIWKGDKETPTFNKKEEYTYDINNNRIITIKYKQDKDGDINIYPFLKEINTYNSDKKVVLNLVLVRKNKNDNWKTKWAETYVYNKKGDELQAKSYKYNSSTNQLECFYQRKSCYKPLSGNTYLFEYKYNKETKEFLLNKMTETHYIDYRNDDTNVEFIVEDLAVGVEVTEDRLTAYEHIYYTNKKTGLWEIYAKKENTYNRKKQLTGCILYQNGK